MAKEALTIQLKQSVWLRYYLLLLHGLIFAVTLSLAVDWLWRTGLCLLVLFSFCFYYRSHYLATGRYNARMLMRLSDETWTVDYGDGRQVADLVFQQSVVIPQLAILYFKTPSFWQSHSLVITADQVESECFRQLRVYCRDPKTFQQ